MDDTGTRDYLTLEPLRTRIEMHQRYSEFRDDPKDAALVSFEGIARGTAVVDVGCGTGSFLRRVRASGHDGPLIGVDASEAALVSTRKAGIDAVLQGDACRLPIRSRSVGACTERHMLYHVDDLEVAIEEAHRVLAPRGRYVAVVNLARSSPNLKEFVASLVLECGITPPVDVSGRADSDNVPHAVGVRVRHDHCGPVRQRARAR